MPGKNIRLLNGHPLIAYSIMASKLSKNIQRTIVSTDSKEIADIAKNYGAEVPFLRPADISGDNATDYEFFKHAIEWFEENEGKVPEYFVHLRPTTPLRNPHLIDEAINLALSNTQITSLRSVHKMSESAYKFFEIENNLLKTLCKGSFKLDSANDVRQSYPDTFIPNGYVDIIKTQFVSNMKEIHGNHVIPFITPVTYEVDNKNDFVFLEFLTKKNRKIFENLFGGK